MNKRQLKSVIKDMVRESLLEIFAEMKLETIVENVVNKQNIVSRPKRAALQEVAQPRPAQSSVHSMKQKLLSQVQDDGSVWQNIYEGIENNSVLNETGPAGPGQPDMTETVSEDQLAALGLLKDYSDLI